MASSRKRTSAQPQQTTASRVRRQHRSAGQARREALLDAAMEVIAAKGMSGVTHRAVTEAAGVPLATVSYFFDSISDLASEAIRVYTKRRMDRLHELVAAAEADPSPPDSVGRLVSENRLSPEGIQGMVEIYLLAGRDPEMRQPAADMLAAVDDFTAAALRVSGAPDPESMARAFIALTDGYSLHSLASPDRKVASDDLRNAMRAMFVGYLLLQGHTDQLAALAAQQQQPPSRSRRRKSK